MNRLVPIILLISIFIYWFKTRNEHEKATVNLLTKLVCEKSLLDRTQAMLQAMDADREQRINRAKGLSVDVEKTKVSYHLFRRLTGEVRSEEPGLRNCLDPMDFDMPSYHKKVARKVIRRAKITCDDKIPDPSANEETLFQFIEYYLKTYR